jgi:threonine/homoserine/homoserine lactone efflux protein
MVPGPRTGRHRRRIIDAATGTILIGLGVLIATT